MSNYSVIASWSSKDALPSGNANKLVSATELGLEFAAIATSSATKEDAINKSAASGYAGLDASARLLAVAFPALTGDVTTAGSSLATTIAANAVTNAKAAQMATLTIKGNNTGGTANALDLTVAQVNLMLPVFTSALNGLAPLSGGGTTNFLRADGSWAAPPGGSSAMTLNSQSAAYALVIGDANNAIYHPTSDVTARIWTIPANGSVAYPIGTTLTFINDTGAGAITISITTDTLKWAGAGSTGSRTLSADGIATAVKMTATTWQIAGTNLT